MTKSTCSVEDCEKSRYVRGMCTTHYQRVLRLGSTELPVRERRTCRVAECSGDVRGRGLCNKHYLRWWLHGDPLHQPSRYRDLQGEMHPSWRGNDVGWGAVHDRLRARFGKASAHACADCGGPAKEWSYDHSDPDERPSAHGPYSHDLSRYQPRCVRCHRQFDLGKQPLAKSVLIGQAGE